MKKISKENNKDDVVYIKAEITIINNKSQSKYIMNHTYKKPSYYKLEIIEPKNLNGKTIEYYKDKII